MEIIEVNSIREYSKSLSFIGMGTTAMCFKTPNGEVVKKYIDSYHTRELFSRVNMLENLEIINGIQNDTYIGPEKVLVDKQGNVIGYIYPYIGAPILKRLRLSTSIFDLLLNYEKLLADTNDISNQGFRLFDVHLKNILFDGTYYVIDLDKGRMVDEPDTLVAMYNVECLKNNIINKLFGLEPWELIRFTDYEIQSEFTRIDWSSVDSINDFFELLLSKTNSNDLSIKKLRRTIRTSKFENSYYKG